MKRLTHPHKSRRGVTLTEVLMSMMIMSIGVASVATLFPIAALRSAQATKLTNGALLKYNVESMVRARPQMIFDPDGDFAGTNFGAINEHFRNNGQRRYVVDPTGFYAGVPFGTQGSLGDLPRFDAGIGENFGGANQAVRERIASQIATLGDTWDTVVDDVAMSFVWSDDTIGDTNPDPDVVTMVGVQLDSEIDLSGTLASSNYISRLNDSSPSRVLNELTRITVFSADGRISNSFPLTFRLEDDPATLLSENICLWTEVGVQGAADRDYNLDGLVDLNPLPPEFDDAVGRVVIQARRTADFNWLMTVRRGGDGRASGVDVAVFFGGGRNPENEHVYTTDGIDGDLRVDSNDNGDPTDDVDGGFVDGQFRVQFTYDPATEPEPFLKRGAFLLDTTSARWYRIADHEDVANGANRTVTITTEAQIAETTAPGTGLILLPGIVDVYPLGSVPLPERFAPQRF